jgi:transcriptional regulator with XRE-family HTH domain
VADAGHSTFWNDLAHDLEDPQFLREYVAQSIRIATIDRIVNELDAAREAAGLSKAELARAINSEPATVRRLFSAGQVNPTLGTLAEVAAALGMRVVLEPLETGDRKRITGPLLAGSTDDPKGLARRLDAMRRKPGAASASALSLDHNYLLSSATHASTARRTVTMSPTSRPSVFRTHVFTGTM